MSDAGGVVVVTGGTIGIGRAIATEFAQHGWDVVLSARTQADVDAVTSELAAAGHSVRGVRADVTDPDAVQQLVDRAAQAFGPIDVLVNNAGIPGPRTFAQQVKPADFLEVLRVNLWGAFLCARAVLPSMIERHRGRIINMTGGGAATGRPLRGGLAYASSKAGVEGMTRNLAVEVERLGITVNAISPGRIATRGFPQREDDVRRAVPFASPQPAARLAMWLASAEAAGTTGETIDAQQWDAARQNG